MVVADPQTVLKMLRQLPPNEQLKVISLALPEIEKSLGEKQARARKSLRGLWKDLLPSVSEKDIDDARREMWKDFPREDIL